MDALINFVAHNLILTAIVLFLLFKGFTSGSFNGLIRWAVLIVLVIVGVQACNQFLSDKWKETEREIEETFLGGLCAVIRIGPICDGIAIYEGAVASEQRRRACYTRVINDPGVYSIGGAEVARQCAPLEQDYPAWQQCVEDAFERVDALRGRLLPCQPYGPESIFDQFKSYSRPFACILGIDSWCEVADKSSDRPLTPLEVQQQYVHHQPYLDCLHQLGLDYGLRTRACYDAIDQNNPDSTAAWAVCMTRAAESELESHVSNRELSRCRNLVP